MQSLTSKRLDLVSLLLKVLITKFSFKFQAEVAGSVSERGDLDLGFTLEVMGSQYIGGTRSALITWKQGGKLSSKFELKFNL